MVDPLLRVAGLDVTYGVDGSELRAIRDLNFEVRAGEIVGIVGESGCGKTTLSSAILRLLPANADVTRGEINFQGRDLMRLNAEAMRKVRGGDVAMIFQDPMTSLNPLFRVGSQLMEVQRAHAAPRGQSGASRQRAVEALTNVGIPDADERFSAFPHEFSGGMRQRVMIAMALLLEPALLIADEPTSALDVTLQAQILALLRQLRDERGTAIAFVSHDLGVIAQLCDRVSVMYAGCVVEENATAALFDAPRHPYTRALLASIPSREHRGGDLATIPGRVPSLASLPAGCKFADRCSWTREVCREREPMLLGAPRTGVRCHMHDPRLAAQWAETTVSSAWPAATENAIGVAVRQAVRNESVGDPPPPVHVELRGLYKYFGEATGRLPRLHSRTRLPVRAVDGVDLIVRRGEIVGLVGESGSGKTTLGELIVRVQRATQGQILFEGEDLGTFSRPQMRAFRRRAQMIFQDAYASLSPRARVATLLREPYSVNRVPLAERVAVDELLGMVGLPAELAGKYPNQLSGGQARRVSIARALALKPDLIVADEPTAGLDVSAAAAVLNLMRDLQRRLGLTFIVITHNINLVAYMADRIAVMYVGQIIEEGPTAAILTRPAHPYTQGLLASTPEADPRSLSRHRLLLPGEIPSPRTPPPGCRFHPRCRYAQDICTRSAPALEATDGRRSVACHFWEQVRDDASTTRASELASHVGPET